MSAKSTATVSEASKQPEFRANYESGKIIAAESPAKFKEGDSAWLSRGKQGAFEVKIFNVKFEAGAHYYQVDTKEGILYKSGEWFPQEDLSDF